MIFLALALLGLKAAGQHQLVIGTVLEKVKLQKADTLSYLLSLKKDSVYRFQVDQLGIAVSFKLLDASGQTLLKSRRPEDITGWLSSEYSPLQDRTCVLKVCRYPDPENTPSGQFTLQVSALSPMELVRRKQIKKELAAENRKTVLTADIDHFWQAFDALTVCRTKADSAAAFQRIYLDRATDGLIDFMAAREITAERLQQAVARYPRFYASVRANTYGVKKSEALIKAIYKNFKALYGRFKPFKVCFAIGIANTGGTVSNEFVLIGTEVLASSGKVDVSEFIRDQDISKAGLLSAGGDLKQKIRSMVAHECVHTQQLSTGPGTCPLLSQVLREGICDFVGKLVAGGQINEKAHHYGDAHEKQLWEELRSGLCNGDPARWLYNGHTSKDRPADLGYYMGYRIAKAYYDRAADKRQAIAEMILLNDAQQLLRDSGYEELMKEK